MDYPAFNSLLIPRIVSESVQPDGMNLFLSNTKDLRCCTAHFGADTDSDLM